MQGEVFVEFIVAPDGHARIPRILFAVPSGYFEATVRDSVMRSTRLQVATSVSTFYRDGARRPWTGNLLQF